MSLTLTDVEKIAKLSRLSLNEQEKAATLDKLNAVFAMVEKMQSVQPCVKLRIMVAGQLQAVLQQRRREIQVSVWVSVV